MCDCGTCEHAARYFGDEIFCMKAGRLVEYEHECGDWELERLGWRVYHSADRFMVVCRGHVVFSIRRAEVSGESTDVVTYYCPMCDEGVIVELWREDGVYNCEGEKIVDPAFITRICDSCYYHGEEGC